MSVKERLLCFINSENISVREFERRCSLANGYVKGIKHSVLPAKMQSISLQYPTLNTSWLMTGEGEMLKSDSIEANDKPATGKLIPFYDAEVAAGADYVMNMDPARQTGVIEIGSILHDSELAVRVYGNSMVPNYPAGCVIGVKRHTDSFIEPGRVYVVETEDNRYLKRLYYNDDRTSFHCLSDNQMKYEEGPREGRPYYQDFEIPLDEVVRVHRVVGVIKRSIM